MASYQNSLLRRLHWVSSNPGYRRWVTRKLLENIGYNCDHWVRIVQIRAWEAFLSQHLGGEMLEISPGGSEKWKRYGRTYTSVNYPEFDICSMTIERHFDIVVADNIFEHLSNPYEAGRNVHKMLRAGGWFLITTPFLLGIHGSPNDYTRWTPAGLEVFLRECGFANSLISAWGNRACVAANLGRWVEYGWYKNLKNEPNYPVVVWAFAQK